jgi:hypothetical protein
VFAPIGFKSHKKTKCHITHSHSFASRDYSYFNSGFLFWLVSFLVLILKKNTNHLFYILATAHLLGIKLTTHRETNNNDKYSKSRYNNLGNYYYLDLYKF